MADPKAPAVTMNDDQFSRLLDAVTQRPSGDPDMAKLLMEVVAERRRTTRQSNSYHGEISPFSHPEGELAHPKAKLDRETWFCSCRQEEAQLTPDEIDLYNAIQVSKTWRGDPKMGAEVTPKRRFIMLPHVSIDERMSLPPSLALILMELQSGADAVKPEHMADELLALRAQVAALAAKVNAAPEMTA